MTFARLSVRAAGGLWRVRDRARDGRNRVVRKAWRLLYERYLAEHGSFIGLGAEFAGPPTFPHGPYGVFISNKARVGRDCVIFQHVTIGSNNLPDSAARGAPALGDGCMLGAGAVVVGAVALGDNVRIGAGCVVAKDVPSDSVVVSQPPRFIQKRELDNRFVPMDG